MIKAFNPTLVRLGRVAGALACWSRADFNPTLVRLGLALPGETGRYSRFHFNPTLVRLGPAHSLGDGDDGARFQSHFGSIGAL